MVAQDKPRPPKITKDQQRSIWNVSNLQQSHIWKCLLWMNFEPIALPCFVLFPQTHCSICVVKLSWRVFPVSIGFSRTSSILLWNNKWIFTKHSMFQLRSNGAASEIYEEYKNISFSHYYTLRQVNFGVTEEKSFKPERAGLRHH